MGSAERRVGASSFAAASFTLLHIDQTLLLLPRGDVRALELAIDMDRQACPAGGIGWIAFGQQRCPVYCPSAELDWQADVAHDRGVCAVIGTGNHMFGLLCGEVSLVNSDDIVLHEMPPAMAGADSPFRQLAIHGGLLACVSSAEDIFARLPALDPARAEVQ
jgi:hypothetical protein